MRVDLAYSPAPAAMIHLSLELPEGSTVGDGLRASGLMAHHPELQADTLMLGIWGQRCTADTRLRESDRIDVYRPLTVDPKEARRLRYRGSAKR
ncbi:MAG: hypothetical protein RLZZ618_3746 [Pseudomonadota bacterium]|jgi:putative ubiquitin-RnfH superfamily antitoxin RatB of RatAB toxin-antitoxin module